MQSYFSERGETDVSMFTDLAVERRRADTELPGVEYRRVRARSGYWEEVYIGSEIGARSIGRPRGRYDTLCLGKMELLSEGGIEDATEDVARKLCEIFDKSDISPMKLLIVGLGNPKLTPDSVGPRTAERIYATMHIKNRDEDFFDGLLCSEISVIAPGVSSQSGIDTFDYVSGVCEKVRPDAVIAVDSIAARDALRLGSTVQISDTGIFPGSGVGNLTKGLTAETLGAPVIAVGVPTVIDSRHFAPDQKGGAMFVSPREIDGIADTAARIIGGAINQAFGLFE